MHIAFVEDPQHDIDRRNGGQNQNNLRVHGLLEDLRGAGIGAPDAGRHSKLSHRAVDGIAGFRQRFTGRQVKGDRRRCRQSLVVDRQRRVSRLPAGEIGEGDRLTFAVDHKHLIQRADVLGINRIDLHHHFILVQRLVNRRDLPLAEGVIQQIVGILNADPEARHGIAIVDEVHFGAVILLVRVDVRQLRQRGQRFTNLRFPFAQRRKIV